MDPFLAIWAALPPHWQAIAVVGVPAVGLVAAWGVKKTKWTGDDAALSKLKGVWKRMRGQQ